jgi:hypothetical protein
VNAPARLLPLALLVFSQPAQAGEFVAQVPASPTQQALAVGIGADGDLHALSCAKGPCAHERGKALGMPKEASALQVSATLKRVRISEDRWVVVAEFPDVEHQRAWKAVIAAPPTAGAKAGEALVLFTGWTGWVTGVEGEREGPAVLVTDPLADGYRQVWIGKSMEAYTLCSRATVFGPQVVVPSTLKLAPAKFQQLGEQEREAAPRITAERGTSPTPTSKFLRARWAASGPASEVEKLTDGKFDTVWSERSSKDGRGEFVVLRPAQGIQITSFDFVIRPSAGEIEHGTSPKEFWIATPSSVFGVTVPEDAWQAPPGTTYSVKLPKPVTTDCVALVLESGYDSRREAAVSLAEVSARTQLDAADIGTLIKDLRGNGETAETAKAVLQALGEPAFLELAKVFDSFEPGARLRALEVLDRASCEIKAPVLAGVLRRGEEAEQKPARRGLEACPAQASSALEHELPLARQPEALVRVAEEFLLVAPARAVEVLGDLLDRSRAPLRRAIRVSLSRSLILSGASRALREKMGTETRAKVTIEYLRAIGDRAEDFADTATPAFERLLGSELPFEQRYLLLDVGARYTRASPAAQKLLRDALSAKDARLRAGGARAIRDPALFPRELERALRDPEVRVRLASADVLGRYAAHFAEKALIQALRSDDWPIVRAAVATALASAGKAGSASALIAALEDSSYLVRSSAALALGRRRDREGFSHLRGLMTDDSDPRVRAAGARALGIGCDQSSVGVLTDRAVELAQPGLDAKRRLVAQAALDALGDLRPSDLGARLAPLLDAKAPRWARHAAEEVLARKTSCAR